MSCHHQPTEGSRGKRPAGEWGRVRCCGAAYHTSCLADKWLNMSATDNVVETTSGAAPMELGGPHCKRKLPKGARRVFCSV